MPFSLDHIVIAVNDLDRAISDYTALGFTVLRGGEHPGRGSINALIVFEDGSYFELIAFKRPVEGLRWWQLLEAAGPGFTDYALLPASIEADLRTARLRGLVIGDIEAGGRLTPEGVRVEWQTVRPPASDLPFLCADVTPRPLRVPEGKVRSHANTAVGIASVTVAVQDLAASIGRYLALLPDGYRDKTGIDAAGLLTAGFRCGQSAIKLVSPLKGAPGVSEIEQHLRRRGEGVFSVQLRTARQLAALDVTLTHGATLEGTNG